MLSTPLSPKLAKGAFIEFSNRFGGSVPNVILFQYNPEKMTRKLAGWKEESTEKEKAATSDSTAQPFDPGETFNLTIELDSTDMMNEPQFHPIELVSGVSNRIAAIEMLLYPQQKTDSLLLSPLTTLGGAAVSAFGGQALTGTAGNIAGNAANVVTLSSSHLQAASMDIPKGTVPTVLFSWGPARLVPVRITGFSVDEQAFTPNLYVMRASITLDMKILAPEHIPCKKEESDKLAVKAYNLYQQQKRDFAAMNLVAGAGDIAEETIRRIF